MLRFEQRVKLAELLLAELPIDLNRLGLDDFI
jgi:hypothetical protein